MLIGVPAESFAGETRVAVTPETAKKLKAQGHTLRIQSGAGVSASVTDAAYEAVGAEITEATIPGEMPRVVQAAVSFSKGCYPGQELVERMDSRAAQAPRRLVLLRMPAGTRPGDAVRADGDEVGSVTSVVDDGDEGAQQVEVERQGQAGHRPHVRSPEPDLKLLDPASTEPGRIVMAPCDGTHIAY